jgi:hypothetical protein
MRCHVEGDWAGLRARRARTMKLCSLDARSRDHPGHPSPSNIFVLGGGEKEAGPILCSLDARSRDKPCRPFVRQTLAPCGRGWGEG